MRMALTPSLDHHAILAAMLAPALLMAATGSLLVSANARLARVVDRLRALIVAWEQDAPDREERDTQIARHRSRAALVLRACRLLEQRPSCEGALARVARESGLSRAHFFKLFREQVGVTPTVFANTVRLDAALDRIVLSSDPVTSISHRLGFSGQSVFTRFFTAHMGMAPRDYRRVLRTVGLPQVQASHG